MNRRDFVVAVVALLALGVATAPLAPEAQQAGKVYRIGYLSTPTRESVEHVLEAFLRALRELGWVEAKTSSSTDGPRGRSSDCPTSQPIWSGAR
jgi:putative tryptophan/tyrosine transport system substrate-binding protein